jgi:phosphohistidine phosphatase
MSPFILSPVRGRTMKLLVVRHAQAEDRESFAATGQDDSKRPLTRKGIRRMTEAARGLRLLVPSIDLLVSSPLRRAVETARIIADAYGGLPRIERDELLPGATSKELIDWLAETRGRGTACVVGHEPDLSELLADLLSDPSKAPPKLKKGSASLVRFEGAIAASGGSLQWYRPSDELAAQD